MAVGRKTGGKNFEPGNKLGTGRPQLPEHIKEARKLTRERFEEILYKYFDSSKKEIDDAYASPETPAIDLIVLKILIESIKYGDHANFNMILDRVVGPMSKKIDMTSSDGSMRPAMGVVILPANGREAIREEKKDSNDL